MQQKIGIVVTYLQFVDICDQMVDHHLLVITSFNMGIENLIRNQGFYMFLLFSKYVCLLLVL